jgi:regulatory protein
MPFITKITTQKNNKSRYNIYLDDGNGEKYAFSVDEDVLIKFRLKKGKELDELDLEEIAFADEVSKAFKQALSFLSHRMRSQKEIREYLMKNNTKEAVIPEVLHKLLELNYVNDLEFAKSFVRTQWNTTPKGPDLIWRELLEKGIQNTDAEQAMKEIPSEEVLEKASSLLKKLTKQYQKYSKVQMKQKIEQALLRKGYPNTIIQLVMEIENWEKTNDEEWESLKYHGLKAHRRYQKLSGYEYEMKMKQALYRKGFSLDLIEQFLQKMKEEQE